MPLIAHIRRLLRVVLLREPVPELDKRAVVAVNQLPSAAATAIVLVLFIVADPSAAAGNMHVWLGALGVATASFAAVGLPWERWPTKASLLVPLVDIASLFLMAVTGFETLTGISLLLSLPFFWLAWSRVKPVPVLIASFVLPLAAVWAQAAQAGAGLDAQSMLKAVLVPVLLLAFTMTIAVMSSIVETSRRRLGQALDMAQEQARLLNAVLDTANVGVVVVDRDGHDLMMNRPQLAVHATLIPDGVHDPDESGLLIFGADNKTPLRTEERPVWRAVNGEEYTGQLVWGGRDGARRAYSASAERLRDDVGAEYGAVVAFHDVTDLMEAMAAKDDFLATVNHELRTPLTSILGYLEMAAEMPDLDPSLDGYLRVARRNAERLLALVGDLLDAAAGKVDVGMAPVDLAEVLESCLPAHALRAERMGLAFAAEISDALPMAGDERRLGQIVDNLLSNAVKYTPAGGSITVRAHDGANGGPVLEVSDTGPGISDEEQQNLFSRFYRTGEVRRTAIPGAGLGLAITRELVEAHGGSIALESEPGRGSTFVVAFPPRGGTGK